MKKGLIAVLVLFFLVGVVAVAEGDAASSDAVSAGQSPATDTATNGESTTANGSSASQTIDTLKTKTEQIVEKEIIIPGGLQIFARLFLIGLNNNVTITVDKFIVVLGWWIVVFVFVQMFSPFFTDSSFIKIFGAVVIACIVGATGALYTMTVLTFNIANIFSWMETWGPLKLFFAVVALILLIIALKFIGDYFKEGRMIEGAKVSGMEAGAEMAALREQGKMRRSISPS